MDRNTVVIIINIIASNMLLFSSCAFLFQNLKLFEHDFKTYMAFCPILLFLGIVFVCFYIIVLVTNIDSNIRKTDKWDFPYKIVFSITLLILVVRSFLGDFMGGEGIMLNIPPQTINIVIIALVSGVITWCNPKIRDNVNKEF
jgi:hypothetical protein